MAQKTTEMTNDELKDVLPVVSNILKDVINSKEIHTYEDNLNDATEKAIGALKDIIEDGTLKLDPEQLVNAVKTLTKAKTDMIESKRKLIDTYMRGEVMIKALEQDKNGKGNNANSVLLEYLEKNGLNKDIDKTGTNASASVFESIMKDNDK